MEWALMAVPKDSNAVVVPFTYYSNDPIVFENALKPKHVSTTDPSILSYPNRYSVVDDEQRNWLDNICTGEKLFPDLADVNGKVVWNEREQ